MKNKFYSMRVFYQYLTSYCGIALLSCAIFGIFLFGNFVSKYENQIYAMEEQKAEAVLNDLEAQFKSMEQISYSISNNLGYTYAQLRASNYLEYTMLQEFARYSTSNMFTETYFLFYRGEDKLYSSSNFKNSGKGATYDANLFFKSIVKASSPEGLYNTLSTTKQQTILTVNGGDTVLFCFPLNFCSASTNSILCFRVTQEQIQERMQLVSGGDSDYTLYAWEIPFFDSKASDSTARGAQLLKLTSAGGRFSLEKIVNIDLIMSNLLSYRTLLINAMVLCLLLLFITATIAYQQYKPIQRIARLIHAGTSAKECTTNELADIEFQLLDMMETSAQYQLRLSDQMQLLKDQMLRLLLYGEYNDALCSALRQMDISFENRYVGAAIVRILDANLPNNFRQTLINQIEDLSTEEIGFCGCLGNRCEDIELLLSAGECTESVILDAMAMIQDLLHAENIHASLGCGSLYSDVSRLVASRFEAKDAVAQGENSMLTFSDAHRHFERILGSVRMGDSGAAIQQLDAFAQEGDKATESVIQRHCTLMDLLNKLISAAQEMGVDISSRQFSVIITSQDRKAVLDGIRDLILFICEHVAAANGDGDKTIHKVMDYIRVHCLENDLSLERIAAEFNITAGYLSRFIRTSVGCGYKEYMTRLRMEKACDYLKQGMSVADTCRNCGYVNISHFIKTFKQFSGATPSNYQCQFMKPFSESEEQP